MFAAGRDFRFVTRLFLRWTAAAGQARNIRPFLGCFYARADLLIGSLHHGSRKS